MAVQQAFVALGALFGLVLWGIWQPHFFGPDKHRISDIDLNLDLPRGLDFSASRSHFEWYASENAKDFCSAHGYSVFTPKRETGQRKVYDLVMVNTELDALEIRLETMFDLVDYFIIVEGSKTFQGNWKENLIKNNWARFSKYHSKMIYHALQYPQGFEPVRTWDYEDLQRNAMYEQVIPQLVDNQRPMTGDVIIVSDVDEIVRPATLLVLRTCNYPRRLTLASKFYYYSYEFLHLGPEWQHPQATYYEGDETIRPVHLRNGDGGSLLFRFFDKGVLGNAAWHCSSCFATMAEFLNKMASVSHTSMNRQEFRDRDKIADAVRQGRDAWGRPENMFERVENNMDVPQLILEQGGRFRYMLDRSGDSAGFTDYP